MRTRQTQTYAENFQLRLADIEAEVAPFLKFNVALAENRFKRELHSAAELFGIKREGTSFVFPDGSSWQPKGPTLLVLAKVLH